MSVIETYRAEPDSVSRKQARKRLNGAVRRNSAFSRKGLSERLFAQLFSGLVYPQIWEDPEVDMAALEIGPGHRIVTIASGGCNALSYLLADPARIEAVDLNRAHVAFNRLKLAAVANLPDYEAFYRFYGSADDTENIKAYESFVRPQLDAGSRDYWEKRKFLGRRRISIFSRSLYRHGLLGAFIGMGHRVARLYGVNPRRLLEAGSLEDQRRFFGEEISPLFDKRMIRWALRRKSTLFGLGIPPHQYDALAGENGDMASVLRTRLEKLACGFPLSDNYFAWQAFGRGYSPADGGPLPPYLSRVNFEAVRARAGRMTVVNASYTEFLAAKPAASVDRFILLDAQDWMSDAQLNELWREITRTAAPGARVIFRTAGEESILPGRLDDTLLKRWEYRQQQSLELHARDRSSIYGGFHLYVLCEGQA
jgi:S-adenosylmethionine-diacylglycerol 3-amino-3-carboxypropyl transferase